MGSRELFNKRALSVVSNERSYLSISKTREIARAIHNKNPSNLISERFSRLSVSPTSNNEEKLGSSYQLQILKKTLNRNRIQVESGDKNLSNLKSELRQLDIENAKMEFWVKQNLIKIKQIEENLSRVIEKQEEEIYNQEVYFHILKRMKKSKIFLDLKIFKINESLKTEEIEMKKAQKKSLETFESKLKFKDFMNLLKSEINQETELGMTKINNLTDEVEKSKVLTDRQEEWKRHRETMYEAAVIEDRSKKGLPLKESIELHRMWHTTLSLLYQRKKNKFQKLEESFQRVKVLTGLTEINSVVENFLTKESTYGGLLTSVSVKEKSCNVLKEKIEKMQKSVNEISNKNIEKETINEVLSKEKKLLKENLDLNDKKQAILNVHEKVRVWLSAMLNKFNKILKVQNPSSPSIRNLVFSIKSLCQTAVRDHMSSDALGAVIEISRKNAVNASISQFSKLPRKIFKEDPLKDSDLIGC